MQSDNNLLVVVVALVVEVARRIEEGFDRSFEVEDLLVAVVAVVVVAVVAVVVVVGLD